MDDLNGLSLPDLFKRFVKGESLDRLIEAALDEDLDRAGDITSRSIIPPQQTTAAHLVNRETGVVCGLAVLPLILARFGHGDGFVPQVGDGDSVEARTVLGAIEAPLLVVLKAERLMLNIIGRLSGIATLARRYVDAIADTNAVICETRKTTPGLRRLEKYGARCGGATLHRVGLYDAALYKDNHLAHLPLDSWVATLTAAIGQVRQKHDVRFVEVEVDTLEQLEAVLALDQGLVDYVLLDNMPRDVLRQAVRMRDERAAELKLEASGGITLANVRAIAETGVDRISVGAITHSAPALDVGLDIGR